MVTGLVNGSWGAASEKVLLSAPLGKCGPFSRVSAPGAIPYSGVLPVAHSSEFNGQQQRLYETDSPQAHTYGIRVIDTSDGKILSTIAMGKHRTDELWGFTWLGDAESPVSDDRLVGVGVGQDPELPLDWRTLSPSTGTWTNSQLRFKTNVTFQSLWGNIGSVRAYDPSTKILYLLLSVGRSEKINLCAIDVATGTVVSHVLLTGELGTSSEGLMQLANPNRWTGGDVRLKLDDDQSGENNN